MQKEPNKNIHQSKKIKALLCQISPFYKNPQKSIARIQKSFQMYSAENQLDVVLFPEMAFSGYNFESAEDALSFANQAGKGIQFQFVIALAKRLKSYVAFGYIEKEEDKSGVKLFNSAAVVNRGGEVICNYRKTHLYFNDKLWAQQGSGFQSFGLINNQNQSIKCSIAICMDINPKEFTSGQFELADYVIQSNSQVLLFLTNWVDSQKNSISSSDIAATYNYWIHRLSPSIKTKKTILFLAADRVGKQFDFFSKKQTMFYGSSCGILFNPIKMIKNLDIQNQGYLCIETFLP